LTVAIAVVVHAFELTYAAIGALFVVGAIPWAWQVVMQ